MNFLTDYMLYSESNEVPSIYHKWGGLSALSHLIGPRVWTHMGGRLSYYCNMYVLLVGNPGIMKSTSNSQARAIVDSVPFIAQSPASTSKEGLVKLMTMKDSPAKRSYAQSKGNFVPYTQLAIFASEFVSLLNAAGNPFGTIEFFTDIWDRCGSSYREFFKNSGDSDIIRPYISILACLTPETMKSLLASKAISTGMSRRCIFVYADHNGTPIPFINPSIEQEDAWKRCIDHAKRLQEVHGDFSWSPDARQFYEDWYMGFKSKVQQEPSPVLRNFFMTKAEYVIKISMLLAISNYEPKMVHTLENFQHALELVTEIERGACNMFEGAGVNKLASVITDVENWLKTHPGEHEEMSLLRYFWKDLANAKDDMRSIIDQLARLGKVKIRVETNTQGQFRFATYVNT